MVTTPKWRCQLGHQDNYTMHDDLVTWKRFPITKPWFPSQKWSNSELWCFFAVNLNKNVTKVVMSVNCGAIALTRHRRNGCGILSSCGVSTWLNFYPPLRLSHPHPHPPPTHPHTHTTHTLIHIQKWLISSPTHSVSVTPQCVRDPG